MKRFHLTTTNFRTDVVKHWRDTDVLELNTSYQRGDVWGLTRRRNLIWSIIRGIPIPAIITNERGIDVKRYVAVIDGKQRITSILRFLDSEFSVDGDWFDEEADQVFFKDLPAEKQREFRARPLGFVEGKLDSIEDEQEVFELVNFGGVPQGETDLPDE